MTEMKKEKNRQWIGFGVCTLILVAAVSLYLILHGDPGVLFTGQTSCYFSRRFHLYCPGCGGTRAVYHFFQGEFLSSLLSNPIPVYATVLFARIYVAIIHNTIGKNISKSKSKKWPVMCRWEMWGILVVVIGFFVFRNLALVFLKWDFLGNMKEFW